MVRNETDKNVCLTSLIERRFMGRLDLHVLDAHGSHEAAASKNCGVDQLRNSSRRRFMGKLGPAIPDPYWGHKPAVSSASFQSRAVTTSGTTGVLGSSPRLSVHGWAEMFLGATFSPPASLSAKRVKYAGRATILSPDPQSRRSTEHCPASRCSRATCA